MLAPHSSTKTSRRGSTPASSCAEFPPLLLDVRTILLLGARDLLLARQPQPAQGARDRHEAAGDAEPLAALLERGIGLLSDQLAEPLQVLRREYGRVASAMGLGFERAGAAVELQQPRDEGDADQEPTSDLAQRALTALDRIEDPLSEILRIGCHRSPPHQRSPFKSWPSNCSALLGLEVRLVTPIPRTVHSQFPHLVPRLPHTEFHRSE